MMKQMCPPNNLLVRNSMDPNLKILLMRAHGRSNGFGTGLAFISVINSGVHQGLVLRDGFFVSGQPKWRLTACGQRIAQYLVDRDSLYDPTPVDRAYDLGTCPKNSLKYHDYEEDFDFDA